MDSSSGKPLRTFASNSAGEIRVTLHVRTKLCAGENDMKMAGIVLIVIGLGIIIWGAFGFKTREKVLDVGPIHATKETEHNVPYGPIAGAIVALGGVVLLVKNKA